MLVLSREKNESIIIGDNIEIKVIEVRGDRCRLAITAPKEIPVHREEIWKRIHPDKATPGQAAGESES